MTIENEAKNVLPVLMGDADYDNEGSGVVMSSTVGQPKIGFEASGGT